MEVDKKELEVEQAELVVPKDEEIRSKIIEEFGFDETTDGERIDKLVVKEKSQREKLSKAIQQKIKHRTDADELRRKGEVKPPIEEQKKNDEVKEKLSPKDLFALVKADVSEEDFDKIEKFAKMEGITIAEALKNDEMKAILALRKEKRVTAEATNISTTRRSSGKIPDDALLANASKGIMPESDEDLTRLLNLRKGKKN